MGVVVVEEKWIEEGVLGRGDGGGSWSMIKYYIASIELVENNNTIGHNVMNEYCIE